LVPEVSIPSPEYETGDDDGSGDDGGGDDQDGQNNDHRSPADAARPMDAWSGLSDRLSRMRSNAGIGGDNGAIANGKSIHLVDDSLESLAASSIRAGGGAATKHDEEHHDDGKPGRTERDDHTGEEQ
jgi:hypothetical protein